MMCKIETVSAVALALVLIVGMALLPQGIAGISDFLANEKPGTAPMQSVDLALGANKTDEPGYMMGKLALEQRMTTIPIKPEQATMTAEEVFAAALDGMAAYMEANMFEWFEYTFSATDPYLGIDPEDKNNNSIFWAVTFSHAHEPYQSLFLHIDDETGKIIYLNYETHGADQYNYYYPDNQRLMMEGFVDSFLRPLKLTMGQLSEYDGLLSSGVTELELTDDVTCSLHTLEDKQYGTINIEFYITPNGFYVHFPNE